MTKIEAAHRLKITASPAADEVDDLEGTELVQFVQSASDADLKKLMSGAQYARTLFPSGWAYATTEPYPAKLASILVKMKAQESINDLANCFYNKKRKLEPAAMQIFLKSALSLPDGEILWQLSGGMAGGVGKKIDKSDLRSLMGDGLHANGLDEFAKREPAMLKKILMKLPENARKVVLDGDDADPAVLKLLK